VNRRLLKIALITAGLLAAGFVAIQFIPVGRLFRSLNRVDNPPVKTTIQWDSSQTEGLVRRACYDCHSNETRWPWYSNVAPVSWLVTRDVNLARAGLNFSELDLSKTDLTDLIAHLEFHVYSNMPPRKYFLLHPDAKLSDAERDLLMAGFRATFNVQAAPEHEMSG
jgi:hypothetical protein